MILYHEPTLVIILLLNYCLRQKVSSASQFCLVYVGLPPTLRKSFIANFKAFTCQDAQFVWKVALGSFKYSSSCPSSNQIYAKYINRNKILFLSWNFWIISFSKIKSCLISFPYIIKLLCSSLVLNLLYFPLNKL